MSIKYPSAAPVTIDIQTAIQYLLEEQAKGAQNVIVWGTVITDQTNTVIATNQPQM